MFEYLYYVQINGKMKPDLFNKKQHISGNFIRWQEKILNSTRMKRTLFHFHIMPTDKLFISFPQSFVFFSWVFPFSFSFFLSLVFCDFFYFHLIGCLKLAKPSQPNENERFMHICHSLFLFLSMWKWRDTGIFPR